MYEELAAREENTIDARDVACASCWVTLVFLERSLAALALVRAGVRTKPPPRPIRDDRVPENEPRSKLDIAGTFAGIEPV